MNRIRTRPLSAPEACFYQLSRLGNMNSCELITLDRIPSLERLSESIEIARRAHPLSRARLHRPRWWRRGFWAIEESPVPLVIHNHALPSEVNVGERGPSDEALSFLCEQIWSREGLGLTDPLIQVELWCSPQRSLCFLLFICPHFGVDAYAGARFAADVLEVYSVLEGFESARGAALLAAPIAELDAPELLKDPLAEVESGLGEKLRSSFAALRGLMSDLISPAEGFAFPEKKRGMTRLQIQPVEDELLKETLQTARVLGLSAHTLFSTALARLRETRSPQAKPLRFVDLCDLRSFVHPNARARQGCLVLPFSQTLPRRLTEMGSDGQSARRQLSQQLRAIREGRAQSELRRLRFYAYLARWVPLEWVSEWLFRRLLKTDLVTTNPGPVPFSFERCGSAKVVDFINFPNLSGGARFALIYSTFRGALRLFTLADSTVIDVAEQRGLAEAFVKALRALLEELKAESNGGNQAPKRQRLDSPDQSVTLTTSEGERQYEAAREGAVVGMEGCRAGA